jgi:predicted DNA-binding transcriptional regulator AlpA
MINTLSTSNQTCQLISAKELAKKLGLSKRQVFRLNSCGKIPAPIRIGGSVRWLEKSIFEWLAAGAPDRKTFEAMQVNKLELLSASDAARLCRISRRSEKIKKQIGELLLYLQSPLTEEKQKSYWVIFEWKLREYLALKYPRR